MKNLFVLLTVILMTSSFTDSPFSYAKEIRKESISSATLPGGAFLVYAGKNGGEIKKQELARHTELQVEGCAKGSRIFTFVLEVRKAGDKSTLTASSNVLTKEMIAKLQSLSPGDTFEFKSMKAYLPNGKDVVDVHGEKFVVV